MQSIDRKHTVSAIWTSLPVGFVKYASIVWKQGTATTSSENESSPSDAFGRMTTLTMLPLSIFLFQVELLDRKYRMIALRGSLALCT